MINLREPVVKSILASALWWGQQDSNLCSRLLGEAKCSFQFTQVEPMNIKHKRENGRDETHSIQAAEQA